ncbi:MAG: hypothetical protein ABL994_16060 [Verrucomicrobiales bacterium]
MEIKLAALAVKVEAPVVEADPAVQGDSEAKGEDLLAVADPAKGALQPSDLVGLNKVQPTATSNDLEQPT